MKLVEIKNSLAKLYYEPIDFPLVISDFLTIDDGNQKILAQVVSIESTTKEDTNCAILKFALDLDDANKHSTYSGYVPALDAIVSRTKTNILQDIFSSCKNAINVGVLTNSSKIDLDINECLECILKPTNNFYQVIDFNEFTIIESRLNELYSSDILDIDEQIEYRKYPNYKQQESVALVDIDRYYREVCNQSYNITKIVIFFSDGTPAAKGQKISAVFQIEDREHVQRKYCADGFGVFDVQGYDKRDIIITSERGNILYEKFICFFDVGSRIVSMNVRTINYKFENNALNIDLELAKMNVKLTNYLYEQEEKRKHLEELLSYSG